MTGLGSGAEIVVVGAGIAGCTAAYELALRGFRVRLLERRGIAYGASGRNQGLLLNDVEAGSVEMMRRAPAELLGRINASVFFAMAVGTVLGGFLGAALVGRLGWQQTILVACSLGLLIVAAATAAAGRNPAADQRAGVRPTVNAA